MKPLYWKLFLIFGAMIVGASLVVPKALRKNTAQTVFLTGLSQPASLNFAFSRNEGAVAVVDNVKNLPSQHTTSFVSLGFVIAIRFITNIEAPTHSLNAGTRPTKSRVID